MTRKKTTVKSSNVDLKLIRTIAAEYQELAGEWQSHYRMRDGHAFRGFNYMRQGFAKIQHHLEHLESNNE